MNIKITCLSVFALLVSTVAFAQSVTTNAISFTIEDVTELFMPPELYVNIGFEDENGNSILEAQENGIVKLAVTNKGGDAKNVSVTVSPAKYYHGLFCKKDPKVFDLKRGETADLEFPLTATISIPTGVVALNIKVSEPLGFDIAAQMQLSTFEYQRAALKMQGVSIIESGKGLRALNGVPNGKIEKGEIVKLSVVIQNVGQGIAEGVIWELTSKDPNVQLYSADGLMKSLSGTLNDLKVGESVEIETRMGVTNNYNLSGSFLPVFLTVHEKNGYGDIKDSNLNIALGTTIDKPNIVTVDADYDKLAALQKTRVFSSSDRIRSEMDVRDIALAPAGQNIHKDAVAVLIGVEKNQYGSAAAPYAANDAKIMSSYFKNALGIKDVITMTDAEVTSVALSDVFDVRYGELSKRVVPGRTEVFVFYSGHGMPSEESKDVYLFPYDARLESLEQRGYSLSKLYADLNQLNAKSVTVILDACFSGSSRPSGVFEEKSISNQKGVRISNFNISSRPWETNPNFRLFTSSTGAQTSLGFDESESGLFTYFLAVGLQGEADSDNDGTIMMGELVDFVTSKVSDSSRKIRNGAQTPQFFGNTDFVVEKIK